MKNNIREKMKQEKAAVTLLVIVTILTFVLVLAGAYLTATTLKKSQLKSDLKIQEIYGRDVNRVDEIYEELVAVDKQKPTCEITYTILNDTSISYQFKFSEDVKNFSVDDIKIYNASNVNTGFSDILTLSTSTPAYATNLTQNKTYAISFDYKCISGTQQFEMGLYSETEGNLPTKKLTATSQLQHEEYKLEVANSDAQFKILAQIEESNNVTLSNVQILEIGKTQAENGGLIKKDNKTYTAILPYNNTLKYVIVLEEGICQDTKNNNNEEAIKIV